MHEEMSATTTDMPLITIRPSSMGSASYIMVLGEVVEGDMTEFLASSQLWESDSLAYSLTDVHIDLVDNCEMITELVGHGAFPDSETCLPIAVDHPHREQWQALVTSGHVENVVEVGSQDLMLRLTRAGHAMVVYSVFLKNPVPAFGIPPNVALQDRSLLECILMLEDQGFVWNLLPSPGKREALQYRVGQAKIWYSTGVQIPYEVICSSSNMCSHSSICSSSSGIVALVAS